MFMKQKLTSDKKSTKEEEKEVEENVNYDKNKTYLYT